MMKKVNTSGLHFSDLMEDGKYYVDKTLLIKDILDMDDRGIHLYVRPRRFGKSTNITMLDSFFNIKYRGNTWFDDLAISEHEEYDCYRNRFPVIYLNLKDIVPSKGRDFRYFLTGSRVCWHTVSMTSDTCWNRNMSMHTRRTS